MADERTTKPKKRFGQHFLVDRMILERIAQSCRIERNDTVVEIGAGQGQLTVLLAQQAARVVAIEKDRDLISALTKICAPLGNVDISQQDALDFRPEKHGIDQGYILAGNIPYYITGKIIELALEQWPKPKRIVFTVQKEVALRIAAESGALSILGVLTQMLATPRVVGSIPPGAFSPAPKVESAILELIPNEFPEKSSLPTIKTAVKAGFSHPRKLCASNLAEKYGGQRTEIEKIFAQCGIGASARAQDITIGQWIEISTLLKPLSA